MEVWMYGCGTHRIARHRRRLFLIASRAGGQVWERCHLRRVGTVGEQRSELRALSTATCYVLRSARSSEPSSKAGTPTGPLKQRRVRATLAARDVLR